jgi:bla regulator protein BlaR1
VEALLIHELAHILRHDYLVNIVQSITEALLFYQPAVWWVSGHIRAERELCCDDIAVSLSGDAFTYALALAEIESSRPAHLHAAVAANGGSLADRIARLLGQSRPVSRTLSGPGAVVSAILLLVAAYGVFAQSADLPRFAVASIKRGSDWTSEVPMGVGPRPGGRLATTNAPLIFLIQKAYGVDAYQVMGGPAWINSEGYNIEAKPETNTGQKEMWLMLQRLLADRFKLKLHRETRELPVFALMATKGGPRLPEPKGGPCNETMPPLDAPRPQRIAPPCDPGIIKSGTGLSMDGLNLPMAKFTGFLGKMIGREVIDRTGFTGKFDLHLEFAQDDAVAGLPHPPRASDSDQPEGPLARPSIMIALQEQLGLKLESTKGPVEVLVIDHVERPTEN